jgi:HNH endonuclease
MAPDLLSEHPEQIVQSPKRFTHKQEEKTLREKLIRNQKNRCFYCGRKRGAELTLDHVYPRSKGGTSEESNLVAACLECNRDKGDLTLEEYRVAVFLRSPAGVCLDHIQKALQASLSVPRGILSAAHHRQLVDAADALLCQHDLPRFYGERFTSTKPDERNSHVN